MSNRACPTPEKAGFNNQRGVYNHAKIVARALVREGKHFDTAYGYICVCGKWHMTRMNGLGDRDNVLLWSVPDVLQDWARGVSETA